MDGIEIAQAEHVQAIDDLKDQLRQVEATNQPLLNDLAAARERASLLESKLNEEHAEVAKERQLVRDLEEKLRACKKAKVELQGSLDEARLGAAHAQAEHDRIQSQMVSEREALQEANRVL